MIEDSGRMAFRDIGLVGETRTVGRVGRHVVVNSLIVVIDGHRQHLFGVVLSDDVLI